MLQRVRSASALTDAWQRSTTPLLAQAQRNSSSQCSNASPPSSSPTPARQYISLYHYTPLQATELPRLRRRMLAGWKRMDVLGRIYISQEGVNAQLTLPQTRVAAFTASFPELFSDEHMFFGALIQQKPSTDGNSNNTHGNDDSEECQVAAHIAEPFEKLNVRIRDQIVRDGFAKGHLDLQDSGNSLPPREWHEKLAQRNAARDNKTLVLDVRNFYEHDIGRFDGATRIMVDTFRDTFDAVDEILDQHEQQHGGEKPREVMMYCTGGIRCEKVGAYLAQYKGITNVQKLHGGIVNYMNFLRESECEEGEQKESLFKGKNFVFDQRCVASGGDATAEEEVTPDVLGECFQCGEPCNQHTNCANLMCGGLILQCRSCATKFSGACSDGCKDEVLKMKQLTPEALREYRKLHADKWKPQIPNALPKFSKHLRIRPIPPSMQAAKRGFCSPSSRHVGPLTGSSKVTDTEGELGDAEDTERAQLNRYVNAKSSAHQDEELLTELREQTQREFPKAIQLIDEPQGKFLRFLVETIRAKRVLEIGCFTGYSALCMANGLAQDGTGTLVTCDIDARTVAFAQRYFSRSSRNSQIQSVLKDGLEFLDQLALDEDREPFDLIFVDANKKQYAACYEAILEKKLLSARGLLVFDNTLFRGRVLAWENGTAGSKERIARGLANFNAHVAADPRTSQVLLPLWDGLTIVRQV